MKTRINFKKQLQQERSKSLAAICGILILALILIGLLYHKFEPQITYAIKSEQKLNVPIQNQLPDLPNGCEVTSLSMLLNYNGIKVSKEELSRQIRHVPSYDGPYRGNPHLGFVGYMSQANAGWCVYNEPLFKLASKYTNRVQNASGSSFQQVLEQVAAGHPVLIITTLNYRRVDNMQLWQTRQGTVPVTPSSHACVITGYNKPKKIVYVNDPYGIKNKAVSWKEIAQSYHQQGQQAIYLA